MTVACGWRSASCQRPGHRQAPFADELGLSRDFDEHGVEDVADLAVDVVAESPQAHTDLRGGEAGATGKLDGLDEIANKGSDAVVDLDDRGARSAEHRVAEDADGSNRHGAYAAEVMARRPSTTEAARSRAASRVAGCRSRNEMALPAAMCES